MAIGYYDQPVQGNVVNTYVPIPFEEIMKAGALRQNAQDTYLANLAQQESTINSIAYAPGDEPVVKHAASTIDDIARQASKLDLSQGVNRRRIQEQLRNGINLQELATVARNKEAFDMRNKYEAELRAKNMYNEAYEKANDPYLSGAWKPGQAYNYLPQAMTDPDTIISNFFSAIDPDAYSNVGPDGHITNTLYRSKDKLMKAAQENWSAVAANPSMKWLIENYRRTTGDMQKSDQQIVVDEMSKAIPRFTYTKQTDAGWAPTGRGSGGNDGPVFANVANTEAMTNRSLLSEKDLHTNLGFKPSKIKDDASLMEQFSFDKDGMLVPKKYDRNSFKNVAGASSILTEKQFNAARKAGTTKARNVDEFYAEQNKNTTDSQYEQQKKLVNNIRSLNPNQYGNASDFEIMKAYTSAYNDAKNADYRTYLYDNSNATDNIKKRIGDMVLDDLGGRRLTIGETGKESGQVVNTLTDIYDALNIPEKERKGTSINITSYVPAKSSYQASIQTSGGPKNFLISANEKEQSVSALVEQATAVAMNGQIGDKPLEVGGQQFIVNTRIDYQDNGKPQFNSNIRTADGSVAFRDSQGNPTNNVSLRGLEANTVDLLLQILK